MCVGTQEMVKRKTLPLVYDPSRPMRFGVLPKRPTSGKEVRRVCWQLLSESASADGAACKAGHMKRATFAFANPEHCVLYPSVEVPVTGLPLFCQV